MQKKILLIPIMLVSLFTSCNNNGGSDSKEVSLITRVKYCTVTGQKEKYNKGDEVTLTFKPYPYFSLPSKEELFIGGVNDFDYSNETGVLSFNITTRTAIMVECTCDFGRIATSLEASNWIDIRTNNHLTINSITYDYAFYDIGEETEEGKAVLSIINGIIKGGKTFTTLQEKKTITGEEASKYSITCSAEGFSTKEEDTIYIMKASDLLNPNDDDELFINSTVIQPIEEITQGVSGYAHYFGKAGDIDNLSLTFKDAIIDDPTKHLDPINGYIKISATYNQPSLH